MAGRLYLMPISGTGTTRQDPRQPKYRSTFDAFDWTMMDYGLEPACLVYVDGIDAATHTALVANADVVSPPADLDQQIGAGALNTVKAAFEALSIPSGFVQATDTYRQTIRIVAAIFQFLQRLNRITPKRLMGGTVTLGTRFNQLPQGVRANLLSAAQSMNLDTSSLSGTSTLRQIFKAMADQWGDTPIMIGIVV